MRLLDLFSGIGGFSLAAQKAGFEIVGFSEIDKFCSKVLEKNFPGIINFGDIKKLNFEEHVHVITGGFPCQPYSIAGKRKGKEDERHLWPEFYRIIRQSKPCWIVAENVTGIINMELDNILSDLENEGYETGAFIIPACGANAPHRRDRIWIIANRFSERCDYCKNNRERRHLQGDKKWNIAQIQQEWEKFKPEPWKTHTAKDWFHFNAEFSGNNDGISAEMDRIKSLGNAIVPQIAFALLSCIKIIEEKHNEKT